jgi:hypothetical protein
MLSMNASKRAISAAHHLYEKLIYIQSQGSNSDTANGWEGLGTVVGELSNIGIDVDVTITENKLTVRFGRFMCNCGGIRIALRSA